jgi:hypothetical protein
MILVNSIISYVWGVRTLMVGSRGHEPRRRTDRGVLVQPNCNGRSATGRQYWNIRALPKILTRCGGGTLYG